MLQPSYQPGAGAANPAHHVVMVRNAAFDGGSENSPEKSGNFYDPEIRRGFIRKVYSLLSLQLLFTVGVIAIFTFVDPVRHFVQVNRWLWMLSIGMFVTVYIVIICFDTCRRRTPQNYVCLVLLTLSLSFFTGAVASTYDVDIVFLAMSTTALVTIGLTLFAMQTKVDFTTCSGMICVLTLVVIVFGFLVSVVNIWLGYSKILNVVYAAISAFLFCLYLVYDTQMLMGGRRHSLSEEEYVFATIQLFIDIIYIFLDLLAIFQMTR